MFEARRQFKNLVEVSDLFTNDLDGKEADDLLAYLLETVTRDLCASAISNPPYQGHSSPICFTFPHSFADETGTFPHIKTDGAHWINAHSDEMLAPVSDFRLAGIYYIAKRRWLLRNS